MPIFGLLFRTILRAERERSGQAARQGEPTRERHPLEDAKKPPLDPNFAQIAGEKCRTCKSTIVTHKDGTRCEKCGKAIHHDCIPRHARKCSSATTPYR
jgi:hypothetical protein